MSDIVFMDTETLGLHPDAPVWEFAAIRRSEPVVRVERFTIKHDPTGWLDDFPEPFLSDYHRRFVRPFSEKYAAHAINEITRGAHIVGAVPNFDTERLAKLLQRNGIEPEWHYHLIDVENLAVGYLAAKGELDDPPWKSDDLSRAIGVDPEQFARHTAMGDVLWVQAQYDAVMGGTAVADQPYPSARVRAALAEAYDRSAPPMGWPYPERVTQA